MLRVINGQQRSGKSFYCVSHIIENMVKTDRPICTNLPLVVGEIVKVVYRRRKRKSKQTKEQIKARITLLEHDQVKEFWNLSEPNSIIYLDELYEVFSAQGWKTASNELLSYTRQHGHYHDDLYLISHDTNDLNKTIRNGINEMIVVKNTRHMNFFGDSRFGKLLFPGLKFPMTQFRAYHYEKAHFSKSHNPKLASIIETLKPNKTIFKCYNSFSASNNLNKSLATGKVESDNVENRNYLVQILHSMQKGWTSWLMFVFILFAIYTGYKTVMRFLNGGLSLGSEIKTGQSADTSEEGNSNGSALTQQAISVKPLDPVPPSVKGVKLMNSRTIITHSGEVYSVGLRYNNFLLLAINHQGVLSWKYDDKLILSNVNF